MSIQNIGSLQLSLTRTEPCKSAPKTGFFAKVAGFALTALGLSQIATSQPIQCFPPRIYYYQVN
jgi:hypothetical protein